MKTIDIRKKTSKQITKDICLGNGLRKSFASKRDAGYFIAATNRFLTECLVIINETYSDAMQQYRTAWFYMTNTKNGTRTNYLDVQAKVKSMLASAETMLDKFNGVWGSNDPFFSFIDLQKAALFTSEALGELETFNYKRNFTVQCYQCKILRKRCALVIDALKNYGKIEN